MKASTTILLKSFETRIRKMVGILIGARGTKAHVHGTEVFFLKGYIM
jgi:hypothetical protein